MEGLPNIMPVIGPLNRVSNFLRNQKQNVAGKFGELFKKNNNNNSEGIASIQPGMRAIAGEVRPSFSSNYINEGYRDPTMNMAVPNSDAFLILQDTEVTGPSGEVTIEPRITISYSGNQNAIY